MKPAPILISSLIPSIAILDEPTVKMPVILASPLTHSCVPAAPTGPISVWNRGFVVPRPTAALSVKIPTAESSFSLPNNPATAAPPPNPAP